MDWWTAVKELGVPIAFLGVVLYAFTKLWAHHLKTTGNLVKEKNELQTQIDIDKKEVEKEHKAEKEKLETEVRGLYKELVTITSDSQRILGEVIPILRRRE